MADKLYRKFINPGNEYRGKPFWSWNGRLEEEELIRQIHVMEQMGLGGFFMHSRTGLVTEYLGEEWFQLTNACADEAEKLGMEAWLYDEDRWPSGVAGGMVTENPEHRLRFLRLNTLDGSEFQWHEQILAAFSCDMDGLAYSDCQRIQQDSPPSSYESKTVLVFTVEEMAKSSVYNGFTDVDRLSLEATEEYIRLTHEQYKEHCGDRFGHSILGIFTDEPNRGSVMTGFGNSNPNNLWITPWTGKLPVAFEDKFGYELIPRLPEIFLRPDGRLVSQVKWHYVELLQQMFLDNFAKPLYDWCEANDMLFTGHVLHEDNLTAQVAMHGSLMRFYEYMHYPGIDVLTEGNRNYWIVKQLTSVARQLGQKWLLSELYGCTGWQMNFESHKAAGDWQALFGINLRCQHLSWYTMEGEAKRDYPASILHQSAWWKDYHYIETYFARLGLILCQGEPCCDVLVISPVESVWCQIYPGWADSLSPLSPEIQELEKAYSELFFWLSGSQMDFDYADEEMFGRLGSVERLPSGQPILRVGQAVYRTVVMGKMTTVRSSTLRILEEFRVAGGKVVFTGEAPDHVDALSSNAAADLASQAIHIAWDQEQLLSACKDSLQSRVEVLDQVSGKHISEIFCQLRQDGERMYLVALNVNPAEGYGDAVIRVQSQGYVTEWDCLTGKRYSVLAQAKDGWLEFVASFAPSGERVYVLTREKEEELPTRPVYTETNREVCDGSYEYSLKEPNICVLDMARYRIGDQQWQDAAEVLKVDRAIRRAFDLPIRSGDMMQPWYREKHFPKPQVKGVVSLAFDFEVEQIPSEPLHLCMEHPELFRLRLNGQELSSTESEGWWIDVAFSKLPIPIDCLQMGANELILETGFHEGVEIEALYLIGDFSVTLQGTRKILTKLPETLTAGDITAQGFPFYSGAITYRIPVTTSLADGETAFINTPRFEAACIKVGAGDDPSRLIAWQPYSVEITEELRQDPVVELEVVLTRRNTFGPLHQIPLRANGYGPGNFVTGGDAFSEDYMLYPSGLLEAPVVRFASGKSSYE